MLHAGFWLAIGGLASMALLNVGVAFTLAFLVALRASGIGARTRARVFRVLRWRMTHSPLGFFLPTRNGGRARVTVQPAA
jgi:site-specific recombinase